MNSPVLALRRLVPLELERVLFAAQQSFPSLRTPGDSEIGEIHVDLSAVDWVDIGAAAQLVLLVDGWARSVPTIVVTLPAASVLPDDKPDGERSRRASASRFLRYIRFLPALERLAARRPGHLRMVADGRVIGPAEVESDEDFPETYKRVVPLHWLGVADVDHRRQLATHMMQALSNSGEGIDGPDAQAISNVILHELVENVVQHSDSGEEALVCGFAHTRSVHGAHSYFLAEELPYLAATEEAEQAILEIIVGDAGRGIAQSLDSSYRRGPGTISGNLTRNGRALAHNVVRWAFDRWSTERDASARERGVRGLFRVDRLVAKYFGQISVRTGQTLFVREHLVNAPPVERFNKAPQRFAYQPGTVFRIRMTGVTLPGISELLSRLRPDAHRDSAPALIGRAPPETLIVGNLSVEGFEPSTEAKFADIVGHPSSRPASLYVLLAGVETGSRSFERALRFLSQHASSLPIYAMNVRCSLDEMDGIATSINSECDGAVQPGDSQASHSEQFDPVLASHESGAIRWIGLPTQLADLLQNIGPGESTPIPADLYASVLKVERRLQTFFAVEKGGSVPPFRLLRCTADLAPFREFVLNRFRRSLQDPKSPARSAVWEDGPYLTPTLHFVKRWVRVDLVLSELDEGTFEAVAFELARALRTRYAGQRAGHTEVLSGLLLATEERSSLRLRDSLEARFRLHRFPSMADGRIDLSVAASKSVPVIVYADIISSGESIRRATQSVLRRGFSVGAVVALLDTRSEPSDSVTAFGQRIPLVTLIHDPNEAQAQGSFRVISPSLLYVEAHADNTRALLRSCQVDRKAHPYIWQSLEFRHSVRTSGRHLTLTINPASLLASDKFLEKLQTTIESSQLLALSMRDRGPLVVLCPADERDDLWRSSVSEAFAKLRLPRELQLRFVTRTTIGKTQVVDTISSASSQLRASSLAIVFDWGVISGKTIDALATGAAEAGAGRVLVVVANSQLSAPEEALRSSIRSLTVLRTIPSSQDLLAAPATEQVEVPYKFLSLSSVSLGQYSESDCPVCTQADDLLSIHCADAFISDYREGALKRLQSPNTSGPAGDASADVVTWIGALRGLLAAAQASTSPRFALQDAIRNAARNCRDTSTVLPLHVALIELLYVEGTWIQLPPLRYRTCRDAVAQICLHIVSNGGGDGTGDIRAKSISVLRRVSKSEFIRRASEIFGRLGREPRAQGALLFGIHTYLARRYHETVAMLEPARAALAGLERSISDDSNAPSPVLVDAQDSVRYLSFQAEFLSSRARSRQLDFVDALHHLRDEFSAPNYYAHGRQYQAIERLSAVQFWEHMRKRLQEEQTSGLIADPLPKNLDDLLQSRVQAWRSVHAFLTTKVVPLASAARKAFESKHFRDMLPRGDAQWFLDLLETHSTGLAPELSPGQLLQRLQDRAATGSSAIPVAKLLELLESSEADINRLLYVIFRAKQVAQESRPAVPPALLKNFLDQVETDTYAALEDAARDLESRHQRTVQIDLAPATAKSDYIACCPQELLQEALSELLNNAGKHGARRDADGACALVACTVEEKHVILTISNPLRHKRGALPDPERHGLAQFRKELSHFDAQLDPFEREGEFVVRLTLRRWR